MLNILKPSARLARWTVILHEIHFELQYKKGRKTTQASPLSQFLTGSGTVPRDADDIFVFACEEEGDDDEPIFSLEFSFARDHQD